MSVPRPLPLLVLTAIALALPQSAKAQVVRREYAIKAGVLSMLGKCATWPPDFAPKPGEPLRIGILGDDPFLENGVNQLDRVVGEEKLKGNRLLVLRFKTIRDYQPCHILFVSGATADEKADESLAERFQAAARLTRGKNVFLVTESPDFARQGAVANVLFDRATNLIRLEINPDAAAQAGLKLTPDLLRLKQVQIVRSLQK